MDSESGVELRLRGTALHSDGNPLNGFARIGAHHVGTQYAVRRGIDNQFEEDLRIGAGQRVSQRREHALENSGL